MGKKETKKLLNRRDTLRITGLSAIGISLFPKILIAASKTKITDIRAGKQSDDVIRIVIDTVNKTNYEVFYLINPHRIVIDIDNTDISKLDYSKISIDFIKKIRTGSPTPDKTRFVIDLKDAALIQTDNTLPPNTTTKKWRTYFDIRKSSDSEFEAAHKNGVFIASNGKPRNIGSKETSKKTNQKTKVSSVKPRKKTIVIDPGHGGKDPGAIGRSGAYEKNIVLMAGVTLEKILKQTGKYNVFMTRKNDKFLKLRERVKVSVDHKADLFISLHADSHPRRSTKGCSVYTLSDPTDKEAANLAKRENAADLIGEDKDWDFEHLDYMTKYILSSLHQQDTKNVSIQFANEVLSNLRKNKVTTLKRARRGAPFAVLKSPRPSVLIEMGYLSNKTEESLLRTKKHRDKFMEAIKDTINQFDFDAEFV